MYVCLLLLVQGPLVCSAPTDEELSFRRVLGRGWHDLMAKQRITKSIISLFGLPTLELVPVHIRGRRLESQVDSNPLIAKVVCYRAKFFDVPVAPEYSMYIPWRTQRFSFV